MVSQSEIIRKSFTEPSDAAINIMFIREMLDSVTKYVDITGFLSLPQSSVLNTER